jgi:cyclophilin family peptidyl-prolyl cis-trans isomerase
MQLPSNLVRILLATLAIVYLPGTALSKVESKPTTADFKPWQDEWKKKIASLEELAKSFQKANAEQKQQIRKEYEAVVKSAEALLPRLAVAAELKLQATKKADSDEAKFLIDYVGDRLRADDYETVQRLCGVLIEHKVDNSRVLQAAGTAEFRMANFDAAEKHFATAAKGGALGREAQSHQQTLAYYKKIWEEEKALRKAETEANDLPRVKFTTSKGPVVFELFENEAPNTVANFISLVEKKYYDGLTFHRVLPNFMAQGGCPDGTGSGGPGYNIPCECHEKVHRKHFRGSLSMAHAGRDTGGSQFFLNFVPTQHLDGKHTVFGRAISGFDVLSKLQRRNPGAAGPAPDKIVKAEVVRKREHEYKPKTLPE